MKAPTETSDDPEFFARLRAALDALIIDGVVTDISPDSGVKRIAREDLVSSPARRSQMSGDEEPEPASIPDDPPSSSIEFPRGEMIVLVFLLVGLGATAAAFVFHNRVAQLITQWHH